MSVHLPTIRLVEERDYERLANFLANFPEEADASDRWLTRLRHWWDDNPAFQTETPRGWMVVEKDHIVGFLGNIPTHFQLAGVTITAASATTWRVLPDYRRHSMQLYARLLDAGRDSLVFNTTPNESIKSMLRRLRVQDVPGRGPGWRFAVVSPLRVFRFLPVLRSLPGFVTSILAGPISVAVCGTARRAWPFPNLEVRPVEQADKTFDQLWERTRHLYPTTNVRHAADLNWYLRAPWFPKQLLACYRRGALVGYLIGYVHRASRLLPMICVDLWTDRSDPLIDQALLLGAVRHARTLGCGLFVLPRFDPVSWQAAGDAGFWTWKRPAPSEFIHASPDKVSALESQSYFVPAAGDVWL